MRDGESVDVVGKRSDDRFVFESFSLPARRLHVRERYFSRRKGDIGRAVQSAFAPVVEKGDAVDATEKKKKKGVDIVGLSVSMAVTVVCFAGIILFALHRDKKRQKLNALYVQRNHDAERNVPVAARPVRQFYRFETLLVN